MAACIKANGDKQDPGAYCATIERQAKRAAEADRFKIAKTNDVRNQVFGWASVSMRDGELLTDLQGDEIEPAELEKASHDFVLNARVANEMHAGGPIGKLIEAVFVDPAKLAAMGLVNKSAPDVGLWVGFQLEPASYAKVKAGEFSMFSIEGTAVHA